MKGFSYLIDEAGKNIAVVLTCGSIVDSGRTFMIGS
jgi:hypothetical protein